MLKVTYQLKSTYTGSMISYIWKRWNLKMRLFTQSLAGELRKWFRALPLASIADFEAFEISFLAKWGVLASEVSPVLQQEQIPTPISLCHDLFNGVIKWRLTQNDVVLTPTLG
jgi:hypothetical protein